MKNDEKRRAALAAAVNAYVNGLCDNEADIDFEDVLVRQGVVRPDDEVDDICVLVNPDNDTIFGIQATVVNESGRYTAVFIDVNGRVTLGNV